MHTYEPQTPKRNGRSGQFPHSRTEGIVGTRNYENDLQHLLSRLYSKWIVLQGVKSQVKFKMSF